MCKCVTSIIERYLWQNIKISKLRRAFQSSLSLIEFNNFCNMNPVYMLLCKRSTRWTHLKAIRLVPNGAACWVSWGEDIETPYWTGSFWRPLSIAYFLSLLLLCWFISLCYLLLLVSPDVDPVFFVLDWHIEYTVKVVPLYMYIA